MATQSLPNATEADPTSKIRLVPQRTWEDPHTTSLWSCDDTSASEGLTLEYGVNSDTRLTNEYLVIMPNVLVGGATYTFALTATDSYGRGGTRSLNLTVGLAPRGGVLDASPSNGTALLDRFTLTAANWTDDASSLPLKYSFYYHNRPPSRTATAPISATVASSLLGAAISANTTLPLGYGSAYELTVGLSVEDVIGASTTRNATISVGPPKLDVALESVTNQYASIEAKVDSGNTGDGMSESLVGVRYYHAPPTVYSHRNTGRRYHCATHPSRLGHHPHSSTGAAASGDLGSELLLRGVNG